MTGGVHNRNADNKQKHRKQGTNVKTESDIYMTLGKDYKPRGLLASVAVQCEDPASGKTGSFLFIGESHKGKDAIVSPVMTDTYELHKWCMANGWRSIAGRYIYEP